MTYRDHSTPLKERLVFMKTTFSCFGFSLLTAWLALAQTVSGTLAGRIVDASAAPVAAATIEVLLEERGLTRVVETNADGQYRLVALPPGGYELRVRKTGFAELRRERVEVQVGATVQLDFALQVAGVAETLTVAEQVDELTRAMSTGSRGTVFTEADLDRIPALSGRTSRNYSSQVFLLPGTNNSRTPHAPFAINGLRGQSSVNVMVDGADFNNPNSGSLLGANFTEQPVSQEALRSVEVQTSSYKAEYGRSASGAINLVTPSGTNDWHGRFYEFFRNDALDARNTLNSERPSLRQNQFGMLLTGPVIRNRLFLSMNAEWFMQRAANSAVPQATFTQAERAGASPAVQGLLQHYPLPNSFSAAGVAQFDPGRVSERQLGRTWFGRMDWSISQKHLLTARVTNSDSLRRAANLFATGSAGWNQNRSGVLHLTSTLSSRVVNETRAYYTTYNIPLWPLTRFLGDPALNGEVGRMTVTGAAALGTFFRDDSRVHNYQASNDTSINQGRHGIKFGIVTRAIQIATTQRADGDGNLAFLSRADFLAGRPATYTRVLGDTRLDQRQRELALYVQDDFRVHPSLTLNFGLRYELYTPASDQYDRVAVNYRTDRNNFAPRFGFAYTPGRQQSLVLRGGYGLFYAPLAARYLGNTRLTPPRVTTAISRNPSLSNLLGGSLTQSQNLTATSEDLRQPYVHQWNLTTEYRLPSSALVASVGYVGTRGLALPMTRLPNGGALLAQGLRPNPANGVVTLLETAANSVYHSLQATLNGRIGKSLTVRNSFTWSKSLDEVSRDSVNIYSQNNRRLDWGVSEFNVPLNFSSAVIYDLPGAAKLRGLTRSAFGGWQLTATNAWRSGFPFSLLSGTATPEGLVVNRINDVAGTLVRGQVGAFGFQPAAGLTLPQLRLQVLPAAGTFGSLGRHTERAEVFYDLTLGMQKEFAVTERWRLQLRAEAFNAINLVNYDTYANNLADPRFGQAISAAPARAVQLMLRLSF